MPVLENPQHEAFAVQKWKHPDKTDADCAIAVGYSAASARTTACRLLKKAEIQARITELSGQAAAKSTVDASWVLNRLKEEAEADIADLYDEHGALKPVHQWPKIWRQGLVQGIKTEQLTIDGAAVGTVRDIKLDSRIKRTELLGRHTNVQAFKDQIEVTGTVNLADRLARASQRGTDE
jgi:phage terminase small subunit